MPNYAQVDSTTKKVVAVAYSHNIMVETVTLDEHMLGCKYDEESGTFSGNILWFKADKPYIMADGIETVRVTATIKSWNGKDSDYATPIMFIVDGTPKFVSKKADGGYYVDFKATTAGTKTIRTQDENFLRQGEISILAVEVEVTE